MAWLCWAWVGAWVGASTSANAGACPGPGFGFGGIGKGSRGGGEGGAGRGEGGRGRGAGAAAGLKPIAGARPPFYCCSRFSALPLASACCCLRLCLFDCTFVATGGGGGGCWLQPCNPLLPPPLLCLCLCPASASARPCPSASSLAAAAYASQATNTQPNAPLASHAFPSLSFPSFFPSPTLPPLPGLCKARAAAGADWAGFEMGWMVGEGGGLGWGLVMGCWVGLWARGQGAWAGQGRVGAGLGRGGVPWCVVNERAF